MREEASPISPRAAQASFSNRRSGMVLTSANGDVNIIRAELGQHVGTALARIVADELEADWSKSRSSRGYRPEWGLMITGGSLSVMAELSDS